MKSVTYSEARETLAEQMRRVCEDRAPMMITRRNDESVVLMSLEDYEALEETAHLLRSPRNARRLLKAIERLERGEGTERSLDEGE